MSLVREYLFMVFGDLNLLYELGSLVDGIANAAVPQIEPAVKCIKLCLHSATHLFNPQSHKVAVHVAHHCFNNTI